MASKTVFVLAFIALSYMQVDAVLDVEIKKYEMCPGVDTPFKYYATVIKVNATHMVIDIDSSVSEDIGEDVTVKAQVDILKDGEWKEYKTMEEKNPCKVFHRYAGDIWLELEEKFGIQKGVCPLPKGEYKVTQHVLDFAKLPVKSGRKASFRAKLKLIKDDKVLLCVDCELENK